MESKIRKQIYIDQSQETMIKALSNKTGVSEAEIIRQCIAQYAQKLVIKKTSTVTQSNKDAWERLQSRMQRLTEMEPLTGGRTWKREDLYDR